MADVNFRELVLTDGQLDGSERPPAVPGPLAADTKVWPEVELLASSAADSVCIVRGFSKSDLVVMLMSRGQFYVRDCDGLERPTRLTGEILADCLVSLEGFGGLEVAPWVTPLTSDVGACRNLVRLMDDPLFQRFARSSQVIAEFGAAWGVDPRLPMARVVTERSKGTTKALVSAVADMVGARGAAAALGIALGLWSPWTRLADVATSYGCDLAALRDAVEVFRHPEGLVDLIDTFGLDVARGYLRGFLGLRNREAWGVEHMSLRDFLADSKALGIDFKPSAWLDYAISQRVEQGANVFDGAHWLDLWRVDLTMQQIVHGRVEEKYPATLLSHRDRLMKEAVRARHALEADAVPTEVARELTPFERHTEELSAHSFADDLYLVRPPRSAAEVVSEGEKLHHCVARYVSAYEQAETDLFLMRRVEEPEVPFVTIEVRGGRVRQAHGAFNATLSPQERAWVAKWCQREGFAFGDVDHALGVGIPQHGGVDAAPPRDPWADARRQDRLTNRPELWRAARER